MENLNFIMDFLMSSKCLVNFLQTQSLFSWKTLRLIIIQMVHLPVLVSQDKNFSSVTRTMSVRWHSVKVVVSLLPLSRVNFQWYDCGDCNVLVLV